MDDMTHTNATVTPPTPEDEHVALAGRHVIEQAVLKLLQLARREIMMILPALPDFLNEQAINQQLLDFVRDSAKRDVLLLLNTLEDQPTNNHLTVKLAQRLPSRIQLRQTMAMVEAPTRPTDYIIIVDRRHMIRIDNIEQYRGWFDINSAARAEQYAASLLQQWPRAKEISEFRQFHL